MTQTELLVIEALLSSGPKYRELIAQWMTEQYEGFSLRELHVELQVWSEMAKVRELTEIEHLLRGTVLMLIEQAEA